MRRALKVACLLVLGACSADISSSDALGGGNGPASEGSEGTEGGGGGANVVCETAELGPALLRRLTRAQLDRTLRRTFGALLDGWDGPKLGQDPVSETGFTTNAELLTVGEQTARELLGTAEDVAERLTSAERVGQLAACAGAALDRGCVEAVLTEYAPRLFRRPVQASELEPYLTHFDSVAAQSDANTGLRWTLVALLQSPHALYRFELGEPDGAERALGAHEIASVLSYAFTGGPPDDILLAAADAGTLADAEERVAQAQRMIATPQGQAALHTFFEEWLRYRLVEGAVKNDAPGFDSLRLSMAEETRRFIEQVVLTDEGGVSSLLTASYTVLDAELASFYGYGTPSAGFEQVERPPEYGVGLLSQGSLLAGNAHVDSSSPTLRGLLVYEKFFCNPRPLPPPNIPSIEPPELGVVTTRERYEQAHAPEPACQGCHAQFDPIGFSLEHFDAAGRYRADEGGLTIDATGDVDIPGVAKPVAVDGITELAEALADAPAVASCVGNLLVERSFGVSERPGCLAPEVGHALVEGQSFLAAFARLAASPHVVVRSAQ